MPSTAPRQASSPRQVSFAKVPTTYSRLPHDDELFVIKAFARHASHCASCAHPYEVHKKGGSLCSKGHQRALDVTEYVLNKAGQAYSMVDLDGNQRVQLEIPADCSVVRELLKALERGLRLRRKTPAISYDENYPIGPRILPADYDRREREPRYISKPTLETPLPPTTLTRSPSRHEKPYYSGRGSLFESDMKERERRYKQQQRQQQTYYSVGPRGALPVPAKDEYYY
ncbi:hypothetical protein P7C71_g4632, partial [Lecanoromycetidae sp. Uapishka_2]